MSIFILHRNQSLDAASKTVANSLIANGFKKAKAINNQEYSLIFLQKLIYADRPEHPLADPFLQIDKDNFIGYSGSFFFDGLIGTEALKACFTAFNPKNSDPLDWQRTNGQFTLIVQKGSGLFIAADNLGACKIYHNNERTIFSNSFQVLVDLIPHGDIDIQGCYEYAWNGNTFGEITFINQIRSTPFDHTVLVKKNCTFVKRDNLVKWRAAPPKISFEETAELQIAKLRRLFTIYKNCFGNRINTALSGGYDSRLILALFLDAGITPSLFVYGPNGDPDVETAKSIAAGEGLALDVIDKSQLVDMDPERFPEHIEKNWAIFDGWKLAGLFDSGIDTSDRINRSHSHLVVNGGVGEIYRNFFYLPDRPITIKELIWAFFSRDDPRTCSEVFSSKHYRENLEDSLIQALGDGADWNERGRTEMAYPLFRGRYWTARDAALNTRIGWAAFPFLEPSVNLDTWHIPLKYKEYGHLEARMIQILNPKLASYKSVYGYNFASTPGLGYRLSNWSSSNRPIWLRGYLYRAKNNRRKPLPFFLQDNYLERVIDTSFPRMKQFFNMKRINDPEVYNRIATMEYALTRRGWA
ncbi:MAG: hypothetical protein HQL70_05545 [Magnetococcales bacterium]|nr:hypothetical protein [Magnetococcales bacterium]